MGGLVVGGDRDGPKAIFADGLAWLRERNILPPGVTTLARLVAKVATRLDAPSLLEGLAALRGPGSAARSAGPLDVPPGSRVGPGAVAQGSGAARGSARRSSSP